MSIYCISASFLSPCGEPVEPVHATFLMPGTVILEIDLGTAPGESSTKSKACPLVCKTNRATVDVGRVVSISVAPATGPSAILNIFPVPGISVVGVSVTPGVVTLVLF